MNRWQPREAGWRAGKTFLQTFAGALTGANIILSPKAFEAVFAALISAGIAAIMAFAMNLEASMPAAPVEVVAPAGEPLEVTETPVKKAKNKSG